VNEDHETKLKGQEIVSKAWQS